MTTTIRWIDIGGIARFHRITHERDSLGDQHIWRLIGTTKIALEPDHLDAPGTIEERTQICTFNSEEECLLALLALQQGGRWKCLGNTLTGD